MIINKILNLIKKTKINQLSVNWQSCYLCQWKVQIKLFDDEMGVRCSRCMATPVSQMLGKTFKDLYKPFNNVYELSSRGSFVQFLKSNNVQLTLSEYLDGVDTGELQDGVLCQNVEKLTFKDNSFDICTSLEVFEHVEDDNKGFAEIFRVLKKSGVLIFTVPINLNGKTKERTKIIKGKRERILPAEYHSDNIRGTGKVFCFRNYGVDIIDRLKKVGFSETRIINTPQTILWGYSRPVIFAKK